ncbi:MAG: UDP-3-O-(3-hydroxymyristoyl)glucosamine N-acyltransferase [Leptospiraceae bacterium]|nr:UDP-3-O-(3-hydroxymyristoyl)glucosamine N-acyltransferase [Leptospiraceae bacterium]MCP5497547.1 UDP-3-O-(3-hydroxymyristoyl)glucosamine N-acyltransferase [Leptospiraceae bacterium]
MKKLASEIFFDFKETGLFLELLGEDTIATNIAPAENCKKGDLVFVDSLKFVDSVAQKQPSIVVTHPDLKEKFLGTKELSVIVCEHTKLAQALLRQKYTDRNFQQSEWDKRHPSAIVHESAKIKDSVVIGPGVIIGKEVEIRDNSVIMANTVIEHNAIIGENCIIHPNVVIGYNCIIGNEVIIGSSSVVGSEGFGFAQDKNGKSYRIPQIGNVVIEDRVRLGANCCVDRATYQETRIKAGTKFDNLCHVAHNVEIGEDCLLTAGFIVAGSTKIGNRVITSGQTGILDHLVIVDDVILLHRAGVNKSITRPGAYASTPVQPLNDYLKNSVLVQKLGDFRKKINDLEKKIESIKEIPKG